MLLIFGLALMVPVGLNLVAIRDDYKKYVDAVGMTATICAIWLFTSAMGHLYRFPQSQDLNSMVDLIGLSVAVAAYMTQQQPWKLVLAFLFLGQLATHAWFWREWHNSPMSSIGYEYILTLNVLWLGQILCVASPGGTHAAHRALDWMRAHGSLPHPARN